MGRSGPGALRRLFEPRIRRLEAVGVVNNCAHLSHCIVAAFDSNLRKPHTVIDSAAC